jgi:hypothetical protein
MTAMNTKSKPAQAQAQPHTATSTPSANEQEPRLSGSLAIEDMAVESEAGSPILRVALPDLGSIRARLTHNGGEALLDMLNRCQAQAEIRGYLPEVFGLGRNAVSWWNCDPCWCYVYPSWVKFNSRREVFELRLSVQSAQVVQDYAGLNLTLTFVAASALRYRIARIVE